MITSTLINRSTIAKRFLALSLLLSASGCGALGILGGKGTQKALFELPKDKRVLVLVDADPDSGAALHIPNELGENLNRHLYKYQAAEKLTAQFRLEAIRREPLRFKDMTIAQVAQETQADLVMHVRLTRFRINSISLHQVTSGQATAFVKIVDKDGKRLWPNDASLGQSIVAQVQAELSENRDNLSVERDLINQMTYRTGRIFHEYDLEDKEINK